MPFSDSVAGFHYFWAFLTSRLTKKKRHRHRHSIRVLGEVPATCTPPFRHGYFPSGLGDSVQVFLPFLISFDATHKDCLDEALFSNPQITSPSGGSCWTLAIGVMGARTLGVCALGVGVHGDLLCSHSRALLSTMTPLLAGQHHRRSLPTQESQLLDLHSPPDMFHGTTSAC